MVEKRQSSRRTSGAPSLAFNSRNASFSDLSETYTNARTRQASSTSSIYTSASTDSSTTPRQSGYATPQTWSSSTHYATGTPLPSPVSAFSHIIAPMSPPASPQIVQERQCSPVEITPKADRMATSSISSNPAVSAIEATQQESNHFPAKPLVDNLRRFCKYSSAAYGQHFLRILGLGDVDYNFPSKAFNNYISFRL